MYNIKKKDHNSKYKEKSKKLKILIVDDDENARESLKDLIELRGHKVSVLDEGLKCVNRCSENNFDIIFMDYHINDLDGEVNGTVIAHMINDYLDVNTIMYAYTGDNSTQAIKDFKKNKLNGAFIKPVNPELMFDFLRIIEKSSDLDDKLKLMKLSLKNKNFMYFKKKRCAKNYV